MNFKELIIKAKAGDGFAMESLIHQYRPLLMKESIINGMFDEDLYQELCVVMMKCIHSFEI